MNQFSRRKAAVLTHLVAAAICLLAVSGAGAKVIPSVSTSLTLDQVIPTGTSGATTTIAVPATKLGQHADLTVDMNFGYGATGMITLGNGYGTVEDPATYEEWRSSLNSLVVETPPGLVGNPNAIPFAERCPVDTFTSGAVCPNSATVGEFTIKTLLLPAPDQTDSLPLVAGDTGYIGATIGPKVRYGGITKVSLLQTNPEVPALIGIRVVPWFDLGGPILTVMKVEPDTNGDLRLRTTTPAGIRDHIISKPTDDPPNTNIAQFRIDKMVLKLWGKLPNGRSFMTNPTSCTKWTSKIWAKSNYDNSNLDADPLGTGAPAFATGNESSITPDCTNQGDVPFPVSGNVAISSPNRDTSPTFDFTVNNPGVQADGQVSTSPRTIRTTIPASINVDVQQLGRVCAVGNFDADTCPTSSRVGSVKIETPLISAGLSGDVYLVKQTANAGLPDLGLRVRGAITFTQRGTNRYTGEKFNQIETTFENIPQVGFSKLIFRLDGGPQGLLRSLACPTYNKAPALPNFTYYFTAWTGAQATSITPLNMASCFGIQTLKKYKKCLHSILPIHPNYQSRSRVKNVVLSIDGKRKASRKNSPFRFDLPIKKLRLKPKKKHTFVLKATYDDKTVSKKTATFKVCKR